MQQNFKLIVIFVLFAVILSTITMGIQLHYYEKNNTQFALDNAVKKMDERQRVLEKYIHESESAINSLRQSKIFSDYLKKPDENTHIIDLFITYVKEHPDLFQVRFIDPDGNEKIRVDRKTLGFTPYVIPKENLQNKRHRDYFIKSLTMPLEKCWHSAFDLNMENKKIQIPHIPTFRTILPIEHEKKFAGMIVINYFAEAFLKQFTNTPLYDMILVDENGYTISHFDETKSWGYFKQPKHHISKEFPHSFNEILKNDQFITERFVSKKFDVSIEKGLYVIFKLKHSFISQLMQYAKEQFIITGLITLFASIVLSMLIVGMFKKILFNLDTVNKLQDNLNEASKVAKIGFWEMDAATKKVTYNPGIYQLLELENTVMNSYRELASFVIEEDREALKNQLYASIAEKRELHIVHEMITARNRHKTVESKVKHYYDVSGNHTHSIGSLFDITERRREYEKTMKILDMQENIVIVTDGHKIQYANQKLLDFFGVDILSDFLAQHSCICECFVKYENFFHTKKIKEEHAHWIEAILMLSGRERVVSMLDYRGKPAAFSISVNKFDEEHYIINFSDISDTMIEKVQLKKEVHIDKLTGAYNRHYLDSHIGEIIYDFENDGNATGVIFCDIDYFKKINDTYGHDVGDIALQSLSKLIKTHIDNGDKLIRYGGEEFVLFVSAKTLNDVDNIAQKLRVIIENEQFYVVKQLTCSFGFALHDKSETIEKTIKRADLGLYEAKRSGRNRVCEGFEKVTLHQ